MSDLLARTRPLTFVSLCALLLVDQTMHHDNPEPLHYVFSTIFAIAALFWMGVGFVNTLGPRNKGD